MTEGRQTLRFRSVRARLLFWVLLVTVPIYSAGLYLANRATAQKLMQEAEGQADRLAGQMAADLDTVVRPIEGSVRTVARILEETDLPANEVHDLVRSIVLAWPDVYGSTIAVEDARALAGTRNFAPYYYRKKGGLEFADLASDSYAYREQSWYARAAEAREPLWSAPYFDEGGGNIWMITYSVPFFRRSPDGERMLAGVVTADLALDWVRATVRSAALGPSAAGWLSATANDHFVVPVGNTADRWTAISRTVDDSKLRESAEAMLRRGLTFEHLSSHTSAIPAYLVARNLQTLDWRLTMWLPAEQLFAEAEALLASQLWLGLAGLGLIVLSVLIVASRISRPIHELAEAVGHASEGNLDFSLPEQERRDEIGTLVAALRTLRDSLKRHVHALAETMADRRRLEHELEIAAQIQQSMLPRLGPIPLHKDASVAATLVPAQEVGGDLYDYFELQDGRMLFAIGDVSDKGVPAALFMARLSGLLRAIGVTGHSPDDVLSALNARLSEANDACMFVTAGCGVLDLRNGCVRYASAGHDAPLLRSATGKVAALELEIGAAIGIDGNVQYRACETYLAPGDMLVLFTDGVTEAEDLQGHLFGIDRLVQLVRTAPEPEGMILVKAIVDGVATHGRGRAASDDLTILLISYRPRDVAFDVNRPDDWTIEVQCERAAVPRAQERLKGLLLSRSVGSARAEDAALIAEELLVNVITQAELAGRRTCIGIDISLHENEVTLRFRDDGPAFDPLTLEPPDLDAPIEERPVGGLGVHIVRQLAQACRYDFRDGLNTLEVILGRQ